MSKLLFRLTRDATKHHKLSLLQYYQRQYYQERISPQYEERIRVLNSEYAAAKAAAAASNTECKVSPPQPVAVRTAVSKTCMDEENEEFMTQLKADWAKDMQMEAEEFQSLMRPPTTAEEYQQYVSYCVR